MVAVRKRRKVRSSARRSKRRVRRGDTLSRIKRRAASSRRRNKRRNRRLFAARRILSMQLPLHGLPIGIQHEHQAAPATALAVSQDSISKASLIEPSLPSADAGRSPLSSAPFLQSRPTNAEHLEWLSSISTGIVNADESIQAESRSFLSSKNNSLASTEVATKLIAFYLPQFHRIPENDEWWGTGFTEWTNTRKARPLYEGHYQPREPYQFNYYNLRHAQVREWQAELATQYGVYGFCYYHYWFKGKLLLETPLHDMLSSGKPDFPFCLSWANEPWTRNWDGRNDQVLIHQEYGDRKEWKEHFYYLLDVFRDPRYIRVENKPIFIIYRAELIEDCLEMLEYWHKLARRSGLDGIYFIETMGGFPLASHDIFDARLQFEPMYTTVHDVPLNAFHQVYHSVKLSEERTRELTLVNYDAVWTRMIERTFAPTEKKTFLGGFVDWDNTARRGKDAFVFRGASPEKFGHYLRQLVQKADQMGNEFTFINAWNEWAEGTYLEPDQKHGYAYLEQVKQVMKPEMQRK